MKLGKYKSLDSQNMRDFFTKYIAALEIPIIDYVAIGVQDSIHGTSTSLMSRADWQETFVNHNFAEHDPVRKASFNTKSRNFSFDQIDYCDSMGKEVMRQRRLHYIENGIVLMRKNLGCNFMLTLATGFKNFNTQKFYCDHQPAIKKMFDDLICLVSPSTQEFQPYILNTSHRDAYAKQSVPHIQLQHQK